MRQQNCYGIQNSPFQMIFSPWKEVISSPIYKWDCYIFYVELEQGEEFEKELYLCFSCDWHD